MAKNRDEIIVKIKKKRPHLTDDEAKQLLENLETFCELVINYTMKNGDIEVDE
jgi:hypothetical protein